MLLMNREKWFFFRRKHFVTKGNKTYCLFSIYNEYNYYDEATKILHSAAYEMNTITAALSGGKFGLQSSRMTCARLTAKLCENYGLLHYEKDKTCIQANLKMLGKGTRKSKPLVRKNGFI